ELHPYFQQPDVQEANARHGVLTQAWSPIGGITFYPGFGEGRVPGLGAPTLPPLPPAPSRLTTPRARPGSGARAEPAADLRPVLDINGQRFSLQASSIVLGRSSEADITVEDTGVSRRHLEILNQDGVYLAVDLGSTNGSTVDGTRLNGRRELVDGSVITMGRTKITFRLLAPRSSS
ncbi:FHA domain-containing protein, partial [Rothia sp. AR01]